MGEPSGLPPSEVIRNDLTEGGAPVQGEVWMVACHCRIVGYWISSMGTENCGMVLGRVLSRAGCGS